MLAEGFGKTQLCKQLNMDIRTLDKLMGMSEEESMIGTVSSNLVLVTGVPSMASG